MHCKSLFAAAVAAASLLAGNAQASPTWTVSLHGTITSGMDYSGLFGGAGYDDLTGLDYTQMVTAAVDPALYAATTSGAGFLSLIGQGGDWTGTVTVGGHPVTIHITQPYSAEQTVWLGAAGNRNGIYSAQDGADDAYGYVSVINFAYTDDPALAFVTTLGFAQSYQGAGAGLTAQSVFSTYGSQWAWFNGTADSVTIEAPLQDVPEPAALALFGVGILGLGLVERRTPRRAPRRGAGV